MLWQVGVTRLISSRPNLLEKWNSIPWIPPLRQFFLPTPSLQRFHERANRHHRPTLFKPFLCLNSNIHGSVQSVTRRVPPVVSNVAARAPYIYPLESRCTSISKHRSNHMYTTVQNVGTRLLLSIFNMVYKRRTLCFVDKVVFKSSDSRDESTKDLEIKTKKTQKYVLSLDNSIT